MGMEKTTTTALRYPYYQTADGVNSLKLAVIEIDDINLRIHVAKIDKAVDALRQHMDKNYVWD